MLRRQTSSGLLRSVLKPTATQLWAPTTFNCMRYCTAAAGATNVHSGPPPFTPEEFTATAPLLMLQHALKEQPYAALPIEKFNALVDEIGGIEGGGPEALKLLSAAGLVVEFGDVIHVKPVQLLEMEAALQTTSTEDKTAFRFIEPFEKELEQAEADEHFHRAKLDEAVAKASAWRRMIWGTAMAASGLQLAVISRLTFFDLDWDVMEPISYFLGTGTSIAFYLYFMLHKREHTYTDFDMTYVSPRVKKYAPADFDWAAYEGAIKKTEAARAKLEDAKAFAKK